jgi:hypothetical protein
MLFFWYCFDDYIASLAGNPAIGHVPWWVVLVLHLFLAPFFPKSSKD